MCGGYNWELPKYTSTDLVFNIHQMKIIEAPVEFMQIWLSRKDMKA